MLSRHKLWMPVVNNFINYLVNQDKVLSNCLFVDNTAVIAKNFHHPVNDVVNKTWRDIILCGSNKVNSEFLCEHIVQPIDILIFLDCEIRNWIVLTNDGGGSPSPHVLTFL